MAEQGNVLIIDSKPARAGELTTLVETAGYCARLFTEISEELFNWAQQAEVDVILFEQGVDLAGYTREQVRKALGDSKIKLPVILISEDADAARILNALRLGASDYFVDPLDANELINSISRCVRQARLSRELEHSRRQLEAANQELRGTVKMLEQDQQAGRQVQMSMLPVTPMELHAYSFSHRVIPSLFLSGDFSDYFTVGDDHVVFFIADVSGHGSSSAFATVLLKNLFARKRSNYFRNNDDTVLRPLAMLERANQELLRLDVGKFATMVVGLLDIRRNHLTYSIAGHLPLPVLLSSGEARFLEGSGSPVGLLDKAEFTLHEVDLPASFTLLLFSDGILETLSCEGLIEKEACLLQSCREAGAVSSAEALVSQLGLDGITDLPDDVAALFIQRQGVDND